MSATMKPTYHSIVWYIRRTPTGVAVEKRDGTGLAEGLFTKPYTRRFYGDDAEERARHYVEKKVEPEHERVDRL